MAKDRTAIRPRPSDMRRERATTNARSGKPDKEQASTEPGHDGSAPVAVSIISNSRLLREGLVPLLSPHLPLNLVAAYTGQPLATSIVPNPPGHVALLDGTLGRYLTVAWTRLLCSQKPPLMVLVLELADDVDTIVECVEAGACGYTSRGASALEVSRAIVELQRGLAYCSPDLAAQLFAYLAGRSAQQPQHIFSLGSSQPKAPLTEREMEVLGYIAQDYSNQEIAEKLVIEVHTVKHHVHNILEKFKLQHRWDAARLAIARGWVDPHAATPLVPVGDPNAEGEVA